MNFINLLAKTRFFVLFFLSFSLLLGCDEQNVRGTREAQEAWSAGDLRGANHTLQGINSFSVNSNGGSLNGNSCCISLPDKWRPGLKAHIEWETYDSSLMAEFPGYKDWEKYEAWKKKITSTNTKHSTTVDIPDYGNEHCGLTVHFLVCNQIKVTASCWALSRPEYPIKEPYDMKEPTVCPN